MEKGHGRHTTALLLLQLVASYLVPIHNILLNATKPSTNTVTATISGIKEPEVHGYLGGIGRTVDWKNIVE